MVAISASKVVSLLAPLDSTNVDPALHLHCDAVITETIPAT